MSKNICDNKIKNASKVDCFTHLPNDNHLKINFETYEVQYGPWNIGKLTSLIVTNPNGTEQKIDLKNI
jgi:hypothetical protein